MNVNYMIFYLEICIADHKGVDHDSSPLEMERLVQDLDSLGYRRAIFRSDQELIWV